MPTYLQEKSEAGPHYRNNLSVVLHGDFGNPHILIKLRKKRIGVDPSLGIDLRLLLLGRVDQTL